MWMSPSARALATAARKAGSSSVVNGSRTNSVLASQRASLQTHQLAACGGAGASSSFSSIATAQPPQLFQQPQQQYQQSRSFGKKIVDIRRSEQRAVWQSYLSGQTSDLALFNEIDLNKSSTISVEEINYFLDSVERNGVDEKKFGMLQQLGNDHQLDTKEFQSWLRMATDVKDDGTEFAVSEEDEESSSSSSSSDEDEPAQAAPKKKKVVDARRGIQTMVWDIFLTTGTQAPDLFKMIDLNRSSKISVEEISYFIDSIGGKGVSFGKLNELKEKGRDHELDEEEFYEWLSDATGVSLNEEGEEEFGLGSDSADGKGCTPGSW